MGAIENPSCEHSQSSKQDISHDNVSDVLSMQSSTSAIASPQSGALNSVSPVFILQSRYRVVDNFSNYNSCNQVYVARLLYHRTLFLIFYHFIPHKC